MPDKIHTLTEAKQKAKELKKWLDRPDETLHAQLEESPDDRDLFVSLAWELVQEVLGIEVDV